MTGRPAATLDLSSGAGSTPSALPQGLLFSGPGLFHQELSPSPGQMLTLHHACPTGYPVSCSSALQRVDRLIEPPQGHLHCQGKPPAQLCTCPLQMVQLPFTENLWRYRWYVKHFQSLSLSYSYHSIHRTNVQRGY